MYSIEATNKFIRLTSIDTDIQTRGDIQNMILKEAQNEIDNGTFKYQTNQYDKAIELVVDRCIQWYKRSYEYDPEPIHEFIYSHRISCVYFVMLRRHIDSLKKGK